MNDFIGSEWSKWDLHIHSKYSLEHSSKLEVKNIFDRAIEKGIRVISVTEHTNFDSLDEIWNLWENDNFDSSTPYKNIIDFIPGIELKADCGKRGVHFIALFPKNVMIGKSQEKVTKSFLKDNFLSKLDCTEADIKLSGNGIYKDGILSRSVNLEVASKLAHKYKGLIIVHNGYKDHAFDDEISHPNSNPDENELLNTLGDRKEELMANYIDICEFPNLNEYHKKEANFYWKRFKKPSIICSDSHEQYEGTKFTWIKAEPNIEGLRQVLYEKTRISMQIDEPLKPLNKINSITINFPDDIYFKDEKFCFSNFKSKICFSPYFTCLIGGRGTGKSSLLNILYDSIKEDSIRLELTQNNKRLKVSEYTKLDFSYSNIEYLSQNEIEEFAKNKIKLTEAIYTRLLNLYKEELVKYESLLDKSVKSINSHLTNNLSLYSLKLDKEKKLKELNEKSAIIESFTSEEYKLISDKIQELNEDYQKLENSKSNYTRLTEDLKELIDQFEFKEATNLFEKAKNNIIEGIRTLLESFNEDYFKNDLSKLSELEIAIDEKQKELKAFLTQKGLSEENLSDVTSATGDKSKILNEIDDIDQKIKAIEEKIKDFDLSANLNNSKKYKDYFDKLLDNINSQKLSSMDNKYVKSIKLSYEFNWVECQNKIFEAFKSIFKNILDKYREESNFDDSKLKELLTSKIEIIDNKAKYLGIIKNADTQSKAKQFLLYFFELKDEFYEFFKLIVKQEIINYNLYKLIKVQYDDKDIENTSFGQRCTGALVIILSLGNSPIIIDEPESHLDSALISNYLVDLIIEHKKHRQIIFATHNANFVINGDSELIHILEISKNNRTSIISTTIERPETRDSLIALEGGEDAFINREAKYGIKLL